MASPNFDSLPKIFWENGVVDPNFFSGTLLKNFADEAYTSFGKVSKKWLLRKKESDVDDNSRSLLHVQRVTIIMNINGELESSEVEFLNCRTLKRP